MAKIQYTAYSPRYILNLDDLPKTVQADGTVWPIYLSARNCGRLFHVNPTVIKSWVERYNLPAIRVGNYVYISVPDLNAWLRERTEYGWPAVDPDFERIAAPRDPDEGSRITDGEL